MRIAAATFAELGFVALGGVLGTLGRYGISLLVGDVGDVPLGILLINITGAFGLGMQLELLAIRGNDTGARRRTRLILGTGLLGGFTTYGLLASDIAVMLSQGQALTGFIYGSVTLIGGAIASWLGISLASATRGTTPPDGTAKAGALS